MNANYIVRLDDACPTLLRKAWYPLEAACDRLGIRPVVGVIPDNLDSTLLCDDIDPEFWDRVRNWVSKDWTIALHGLHHVYHPIPSGQQALIPLHDKSEFVGLSLEEQCALFRESWGIFLENGVRPTVFMAPSHSFDANTLLALCMETDIQVITDGRTLFPYRDGEFVWVPQQLWRFRRLPLGVWTVCFHPNTMTEAQVEFAIEHFEQFAGQIVSIEDAVGRCSDSRRIYDHLFSSAYGLALGIKRLIR